MIRSPDSGAGDLRGRAPRLGFSLKARNAARAEREGREWAVRAVLETGRERLIRQVLAETFVIALAGGTLGLALAAASLGEPIRSPIRKSPSICYWRPHE